MHAGQQIFESYMPAEFKDDQSWIQGFCARLDRYLDGGEWAGDDEGGSLSRWIGRLLRRQPGDNL